MLEIVPIERDKVMWREIQPDTRTQVHTHKHTRVHRNKYKSQNESVANNNPAKWNPASSSWFINKAKKKDRS